MNVYAQKPTSQFQIVCYQNGEKDTVENMHADQIISINSLFLGTNLDAEFLKTFTRKHQFNVNERLSILFGKGNSFFRLDSHSAIKSLVFLFAPKHWEPKRYAIEIKPLRTKETVQKR